MYYLYAILVIFTHDTEFRSTMHYYTKQFQQKKLLRTVIIDNFKVTLDIKLVLVSPILFFTNFKVANLLYPNIA